MSTEEKYHWQRIGQRGENNPNWLGDKRKSRRLVEKDYYWSHREKTLTRIRRYRKENRDRVNEWRRRSNANMLKNWIGVVPQEASCEMCGRKLTFNSGKLDTSIHFDHKNKNLPIKKTPSMWLMSHQRNTENELIWKSCKFGILCNDCNRRLPTQDREQFLLNAFKYVFGKEVCIATP